MGHTIAEKILGAHATGKPAKAGEVVVARVDSTMIHDARADGAFAAVKRLGVNALPFAKNTALVLDHYSPPPNADAANTHIEMREFADRHGARLFDVGSGICHQLMPENGYVTCGAMVCGTDTHSVTYGAFNAFGTGVEGTDLSVIMATGKNWFRVPETVKVVLKGRLQPGVWAKDITLFMLGRFGAEGLNYKAIEYKGSAVAAMEIDDRMTLSNHAAELGAKAAILEADDKTIAWLKAHGAAEPKPVTADADAVYADSVEIDASSLTPQVARKHLIDDVIPVPDATAQKISVALIGTCTNGRLDDIRQAASIVRGKKVAKGVRFVVTPASRAIYLAAEKEGLIRDIVEAGGSFDSAGCGTCVGITNKLIAGDRDVVITSANRNFQGRLGNDEAAIFVSSSATVAASALTGHVTDPREIEGGQWRAA
ncbi:MAG: aconitase/3-isopropylmalate dehydratase large subunit family protein [Rhodospirillales bacterium]